MSQREEYIKLFIIIKLKRRFFAKRIQCWIKKQIYISNLMIVDISASLRKSDILIRN